MKRWLPWLYLLVLHVVLLLTLARPDVVQRLQTKVLGRSREVPAWYADVHGFYLRQDQQLLSGRVIILGDSHAHSLAVSQLGPDVVNFGIGGDTIVSLRERAAAYRSLHSARAIVLVIGTNDLSLRDNAAIADSLQQLLSELPPVPVLLSTVLPVDDVANPRLSQRPARISELAALYQSACSARTGCQLLDSYALFADARGRLGPIWHEGDGIHLNAAGYARWTAAMRAALVQMRVVVASAARYHDAFPRMGLTKNGKGSLSGA